MSRILYLCHDNKRLSPHSVKIANRAVEGQRPENEPFGQSGTRCALFDQDIEEPFGVSDTAGGGVEWFKCQVNGPREAGRYNLSVALLGHGMTHDSQMNMGLYLRVFSLKTWLPLPLHLPLPLPLSLSMSLSLSLSLRVSLKEGGCVCVCVCVCVRECVCVRLSV